MFGGTVRSSSQRVIGRSGRHERMERAILFVSKNMSAAKSLDKHTNALKLKCDACREGQRGVVEDEITNLCNKLIRWYSSMHWQDHPLPQRSRTPLCAL